MKTLFTTDNTAGYTQAQLDALNAEWAEKSADVEPNSDEYYAAASAFSDEVASR